MNFTDTNGIAEVKVVELKYCERCGGLWLRRQGMADVYCGACHARRSELMRMRPRQVWPERKGPGSVRVDWLLGVIGEEVRA